MTNECLAQSKIVNLGEYVTEYTDSSDYVSSVEDNTPFPSLTLSKKFELERYLHEGVVISKFSESNIIQQPEEQQQEQQPEEQQPENVSKDSENISCCLLL